ncbi:MAG TPA: ABC transporter permease [Thermoanaerobaculia bacterium]
MSGLLQDLRHAARNLSRSPGFTAVAVLTMALGIGATTAIFSVVHAVLWNPLPFHAPERLSVIWETDAHNRSFEEGASAPDFGDFRAQAKSFSRLAASRGLWLNLTEERREPERISTNAVSGGFFDLLGVRPALGRGVDAADDRAGAPGVVVLSDALWRSRYAASASAVGRTLFLDGAPYTIVGVAPAGLDFPEETQAWIALTPALGPLSDARGVHNLGVFGRLKDGVSIEGANAEMASIAARLARQYPDDNAGRSTRVVPVPEAVAADERPSLLVLLGAAALVALISCANVSGLLIARATSRARELAIRRALGAGRGRIVRQLLSESLLLALVGCGAGLLFASWGRDALVTLSPHTLPRAAEAGLHLPVLLFSLGLSAACGLLAGLAPAFGGARALERTLRSGDSRTAPRAAVRGVLVAAQIALACVLTTGAGLLLKSLHNLRRVDPGFRAEGLLTARVQLPRSKYPEPRRDDFYRWPEVLRFYDDVLPRLLALPGVSGAAVASNHPLRSGWTSQIEVEGLVQPRGARDETAIRPVSPDYFRTAGTPVLRGRPIDARDRQGAAPVVVINEAFARRYFPDRDPLGRSVTFWGRPREIVGIAGDERFRGLERESVPAVYPSLLQIPMSDIFVLVRTPGDPAALVPAVRAAVAAAEPDVALFQIHTAPELVDESLGGTRFETAILCLFGLAALLLSTLGLYALLAYSVERRTREIGIRAALGARRSDLAGMIVRESLVRCAAGLAVGGAASLVAARALASLLYGVQPADPVVLSGVFGTLAVAAVISALLPARRAARLDPVHALRTE